LSSTRILSRKKSTPLIRKRQEGCNILEKFKIRANPLYPCHLRAIKTSLLKVKSENKKAASNKRAAFLFIRNSIIF